MASLRRHPHLVYPRRKARIGHSDFGGLFFFISLAKFSRFLATPLTILPASLAGTCPNLSFGNTFRGRANQAA